MCCVRLMEMLIAVAWYFYRCCQAQYPVIGFLALARV